MANIRVIFLHGNGGGSVEDNWFPYLKQELEKAHIEVVARTFPDAELAHESEWLPFLKNELQADANSILVGHSSGAIAAMRYAETNQILGSVLVGAYSTDLGIESERLSGYFNRPWDWEAIKANQRWIVLFASKDDPWIPIKEPRYLLEKLSPEYHEYNDQGHFGGDYPKSTFPELARSLLHKLKCAIA